MTDEYTWEDVIISPYDERVKIGEKYYSGDNPKGVIEMANRGSSEPEKLIRVDYKIYWPFVCFNEDIYSELNYSCLIKAKYVEEEK